MKFKQGKYTVKNPHKYIGDINNVIYRSSWELRFLKWCDTREQVVSFSSEEIVVPYLYECDNKVHRYFPDFLVVLKQGEKTETLLVEIKPHAQCLKPIPPKTNNRKAHARYSSEIETYIKNQNKWRHADEYAKQRGWRFVILTERHLFNKVLKA